MLFNRCVLGLVAAASIMTFTAGTAMSQQKNCQPRQTYHSEKSIQR